MRIFKAIAYTIWLALSSLVTPPLFNWYVEEFYGISEAFSGPPAFWAGFVFVLIGLFQLFICGVLWAHVFSRHRTISEMFAGKEIK